MAMEIFKLMGTVAIDKDKALKDIKAVQDQAERASTKMGGSFTKFSGYVEQHSAQIKKAGKMMTIFGGIATAVFAVAVKGAADFEEQLANVSTMLDESAMKILPEYRRELQSLSVEFGESTKTLSKGLYDILSASIPPAEALGVLEISAKAAAAGITDTGVAADAITTILNSYGFSADQAGMVSDKLFAIVKEGKTTFAELAPSIGKVAATASMAGLNFDDLGACIATMTRAGIRTEETMTAINGVLIAFLKPTDEAKEAAKKFGLTLDTNTLKTEGLTGVMEKLKNATAEQLAAIFPNIRGLKGMAAALGDAEGYAKSYALMLDSAGLTQEAFEKQSATLNFKLGQLKEMFNVIKVTIGTALMPAVEDITKKIMGVLTKVKEWTEANPKLTATMVKWAAGISGLMLVAGPLLIALPSLVSGVNLLIGVTLGMGKTISILTSKMVAFRTISVVTNTTIAAGKVSILSILGPIGLFTLAIAGLILGYKKWREHSEKVREENEKLKASLMDTEEINERIKIVEERIKGLKKALEEEVDFRSADIIKEQIGALEAEFRALIGTGKVIQTINAELTESYIEYYDAMRQATYGLTQMNMEMTLLEAQLQDMEKELSTMVVGSKQWQLLSQSIEEVKQKILDLEQEINELEPAMGKIVTTVKDLTQEMSLSTKEYEASSQAISESITYYNDMMDLLNRTDVILQTELMLLEKGTEEWHKKKEEIADNIKALNEINEALARLIEPLEGLELIAAKMAMLGDSTEDTKAKIELLNEKAVLLQQALDEAIPDTEAWWEAKIAFEGNQTAIEGLKDKLKELTEEEKEAVRLADKLADAYKNITDKIFELTHTPMEVAIRKLDQQKQSYLNLGIAQEIVNKWYAEEIKNLDELNKKKDEGIDKNKELIKSYEPFGPKRGPFSGLIRIGGRLAPELLYGPSEPEGGLLAKGGPIRAFINAAKFLAGGGSTDTVPVMATPGEYLIKKEYVDFIRRTGMVTGGLIEAIQKGLPTPSPQFAGGGMVSSSPTGRVSFLGLQRAGSLTYTINFINPVVRGDEDLANIKELMQEVLDESANELDLSGNEVGV